MSCQHLSCAACRIRVRANDPEIALLEDRCPICEATLIPVSAASEVMGFRCFDLDALSEQEPLDRLGPPGNPADLVSRREAVSARDHLDAHRWSDDGGNVISDAVAQWQRAR
jgi:hypothetical protein